MLNTFTTKLASKTLLAPNVWQFNFDLITPTSLDFEAGQYLILKIDDKGQRNYSIASSPDNKTKVELVIQMIPNGLASTYLSGLTVGDTVNFVGPGGKFVFHGGAKDKIFLATGTGVAPIKSMIETHLNSKLKTQSAKLYLFWGLRTKGDIYFIDEFTQLVRNYSNFHVTICLSREDSIADLDGISLVKGRVNQNMTSFIHSRNYDINNFDYYICGGRDAVESLRNFALEQGIIKEQIYFEKF